MMELDKKGPFPGGPVPEGRKEFGAGGPPPGWKPPMADISWVKRKFLDVPYAKDSKAQCMDIYLPEEGEGPFPLLLHIHGGGFALGDKRDDHMDAYLIGIKKGYAVASVEYRLSGEAIFPAAVLDCREAVRFLKVHGAEYQIDPEKIAVIGGSAGGNLTAMLAMNIPNGVFPGEEEKKEFIAEPVIQVAIDQFGPMDFKTMDDQARKNGISHADHDEPFSPESQYLGVPVPDAPAELCEKANPASYAGERMCPILVQHGTVDKLVPYEQSVELVERLKKKLGESEAASRVTFVPLEGADHEDKMFTQEKNLNLVFDFIKKHMEA